MRAEFDGTFEGWRVEARRLLAARVPPERVVWAVTGASATRAGCHHLEYPPGTQRAPARDPRVSRRFLLLARMVACHRNPDRWAALYRALWRHASGEPQLLSAVTDPEVYPLLLMARSVRKAAHRMKASVRFRAVQAAGAEQPAYVAWFEPVHPVLQATAPFFVRRYPTMRWSILTPDRCAHWDGRTLRFTPGAAPEAAPTGDDLEQLWLTCYAHIFNAAHRGGPALRAERMLARRTTAPASELLRPGWDPQHDPGLSSAAARAHRASSLASGGMLTPEGRRILIGVAGWTDPTLTGEGVFYPTGVETAEARLRYYASRFPIVEIDSTYYALPTRAMAVAWAARTPAHFVFDVKAHGLMTGHGADVRRLPDWLCRALPRAAPREYRIYGRDLPAALLDEVWRRFLEALEPLRASGKLGAILLQFPRWFTPSRAGARWLAGARARLGSDTGAVEFRHRAWMTGRVAGRTLGLLTDLELAYVVVDAPQGMGSSVPPTVAVTSPRVAVMRLHGRRRDTWEARNDPATERYRYLYSEEEIAEHLRAAIELSAQKASALHIIYNNCHGNYAVTNAAELSYRLLTSEEPRSTARALSPRRTDAPPTT
ncbi:MAG TPA: TIGR03915 family putative DNA repair protein [Gemmatimonadales bacterium]